MRYLILLILLSSFVSADVVCGGDVSVGNDVMNLLCNGGVTTTTTTTTTTTSTSTTTTTTTTSSTTTTVGGGGGGVTTSTSTTSTLLPPVEPGETIWDRIIVLLKSLFGEEGYAKIIEFLNTPVGPTPARGIGSIPAESLQLKNWMWFIPLCIGFLWFIIASIRKKRRSKKVSSTFKG